MQARRAFAFIATAAPLVAVACGGSQASPTTRPQAATFAASAVHTAVAASTASMPLASAGDVSAAAAPDRDADQIARLRAQGPQALTALLAAYDRAPAGAARDRLAATIDKVAGQRLATVSRLYWYTDLAQAEAAARASGKPILSLRMLGRLDEDLSCANSRFFRTILYANATLAPWLRDHFVLHWSSERPVPKVTIDFGDGRVIERTVTGNSAHIVLDADGHPLDVLPGLYAPSAFQADELTRSLGLAARVRQHPTERRALVTEYHGDRLRDREAQWKQLGAVPVLYGETGLLTADRIGAALASAQRRTTSKAVVEVHDLRIVDVGADPGALAPDLDLSAVIGQRLYGSGSPAAPAAPAARAPSPRVDAVGEGSPLLPLARRRDELVAAAPAPVPLHLLDAQSTALLVSLADAGPGLPPLGDHARAAMLARLDQTLAADSAQNELVLRRDLDAYFFNTSFVRNSEVDFAGLDAFLYETVFHTPASDPWLGLLPRDTFMALPGDGVRVPSR